MGLSDASNFQPSHRVLLRAVWSSLSASRLLLKLSVAEFVPRGIVILGLDDTIERRRGARMPTQGISRDPVWSSHAHFVKVSGLRWLSAMMLAPQGMGQPVLGIALSDNAVSLRALL